MQLEPNVFALARGILDGDQSIGAARALEGALIPYYLKKEDEDLDELIADLASYSPMHEEGLLDHRELCQAIRKSPIWLRHFSHEEKKR